MFLRSDTSTITVRAGTNLILLMVTTLLGACSLDSQAIEEADYEVLFSDENIEIRHYANLVLVSTDFGDKERDSNAFRKLFRYISGDNANDQKISMTAPVLMDPARTEKMSFVLPRSFTYENAPLPDNPAITLEHWQGNTLAAIRFSGHMTPDAIIEQQQALQTWLDARSIPIVGDSKIAGYDDPITLPMLRRNEVLTPVRYAKAQSATN